MDCEKKEKYLNAFRNQSAIARQNRKISKLHVDVCISQFCQKIKEGSYYVCTVCNRMLYWKCVLIFNNRGGGGVREVNYIYAIPCPTGPGKFHVVVLVDCKMQDKFVNLCFSVAIN